MPKHIYILSTWVLEVVRSDLIDIKNISYAKATDAANLAVDMKKVKLALSADVNSGAPIGWARIFTENSIQTVYWIIRRRSIFQIWCCSSLYWDDN